MAIDEGKPGTTDATAQRRQPGGALDAFAKSASVATTASTLKFRGQSMSLTEAPTERLPGANLRRVKHPRSSICGCIISKWFFETIRFRAFHFLSARLMIPKRYGVATIDGLGFFARLRTSWFEGVCNGIFEDDGGIFGPLPCRGECR
jgi:hypothetical protein